MMFLLFVALIKKNEFKVHTELAINCHYEYLDKEKNLKS